MNRIVKSALLAGAAWSTLVVAANAQDETPQFEEGVYVDEVVVTARRREETLQDVPVAVSAYSEEELELTGAADLTALTRTTPSMTLQVARGSNSTLISFIRGVGQQDPLWGFEPGVGLYVDDVYIARPQGAVLDIFDISRIEVLRGPQGTLYGRNTIGGAIKYVTDKIGNEPELNVRAAIGTHNQADLIVSGETRISDMIGVSAAVARYTRDGYGRNLFTGAEHYNKDVTAARASVEFQPSEDLFFRLSGDIVQDDSNPRHGHRELAPSPDNVYDTRAGAGDNNEVRNRGVSLLGEWNVSDTLTFKSITAYRDGETFGPIDFDNTPDPVLDIPAEYADNQFTQEFQLLFEGDRWQGVAGLFYMDATASGAFDTVLANAVPGLGLTILTAGEVDTKSIAVFGDVSFDVTEQLSLSVGGRWTQDEKTGTVFRQQYLGVVSPHFGNDTAIPFGAPLTDYTASKTFEEFTPRVSASYEFNPSLTAYVSYGRGFKSGGFDMRGDASLYPATVEGYDPEFVDTYEIGLKGSANDRRINFATAIFSSSYEDQQVTTQYPVGTGVASVVDNVGSSSIKGWEFEGSALLTESLSANLMLSYIDAEFDEFVAFIPGSGLTDVSDERFFQNTPKWTGAASVTWTKPLEAGWGELAFTPSAAYRGAYQLFETPSPILDQGQYWLYDASLVWTSDTGRYRAALHAKNITDERYRVGGYAFAGALFGDSMIGYYGPPRSLTATVSVSF